MIWKDSLGASEAGQQEETDDKIRGRGGRSERHCILGEGDKIFPALVSRQCPLVFLIEVHLKQGKALGSGECKRLGTGKKSGRDFTECGRHFDICGKGCIRVKF
jgi:hypothetical protein